MFKDSFYVLKHKSFVLKKGVFNLDNSEIQQALTHLISRLTQMCIHYDLKLQPDQGHLF